MKIRSISQQRSLLDCRFKSVLSNDAGSVAPLFAIAFTFIFMVVAVAIDYGVATNEKLRQQAALDAAMLAASEKLGHDDQDTAGPALAKALYKANTEAATRGSLDDIRLNAETGAVTAKSDGFSITTLLNAFDIRRLDIASGSKVMRGFNAVEIALVLDNSGSMGGQPIADLRTAAKNLLNVVFVGSTDSDRVRAGVVPFAGSVNVGTHLADAHWIDGSGLSPVHFQNVSETRTRFQLFSDVGRSWAGCVEARPAPHDTTDTIADSSDPSTLFVPMFAPDEPDTVNANGNSYYNSYLVDDGGACPPQERVCTRYSRRGNCRNWSTTPLDPEVAQTRTCKYQGQSPSGGSGPNYNCTTQPILPLTSTKTDIVATIENMIASGTTNIGEGVMWGVRVLSSDAPFTEGRSADDENNQKYIVLMTDGQNTYSTYNNHNKSWYGAHGYAVKDRLGTTHTQSAIKLALDAKTQAACTTAKAAGVKIFTVAFRLENDPTTQALLSYCATNGDMAFRASNGTALVDAFEEIGRQISTLRIAG